MRNSSTSVLLLLISVTLCASTCVAIFSFGQTAVLVTSVNYRRNGPEYTPSRLYPCLKTLWNGVYSGLGQNIFSRPYYAPINSSAGLPTNFRRTQTFLHTVIYCQTAVKNAKSLFPSKLKQTDYTYAFMCTYSFMDLEVSAVIILRIQFWPCSTNHIL